MYVGVEAILSCSFKKGDKLQKSMSKVKNSCMPDEESLTLKVKTNANKKTEL